MHTLSRSRTELVGRLPVLAPIVILTSLAIALTVVARPDVASLLLALTVSLMLAYKRPVAVTVFYFVFVFVQDLLTNFFAATTIPYLLLKRADEGVLLALLVATCLRIKLGQAPLLWLSSYKWLAFALLGGLLPTLYHRDRLLLAVVDGFLLVKGFLVLFVVTHLPIRPPAAARILNVTLAFGLAAVPFLLLDVTLGQTYRSLLRLESTVTSRYGVSTILALFSHAGTAGWFFAFATCVALAAYIGRAHTRYLIMCIPFCAGVLLTLKRKPIMGLLLVFFVAMLCYSNRRTVLRTALSILLIFSVSVVLLGDIIAAIFSDMLNIYVYNPNVYAVARNAMYTTAFRIAVDNFPLGAGLAQFGGWVSVLHYSSLYHEYGISSLPGLSEARPAFLQDAFWPHVLGELGFWGGFFFLAALGSLLRLAFRASRNATKPIAILGMAGVFVFVEAFVESLGWVVFENTLACSFVFGLLAVAIALDHAAVRAASPASE